MSRKFILMALAAVATLGTAMVSVDTASAAPGVRAHVNRVTVNRVNINRVRFTPNRPIFRPRLPHRPHWHVRWHHPRIWYAPRPVVYGVAPAIATTAVAPAVASRCTCLTKEYTPEGAVLFKDVCTNEAAMNPPAAQPAPTAQVQPQQ